MKQQDLWDALCGDGNQPWPSEALYDVEGLHRFELDKLYKMHQAGETLPAYEELRNTIREREANGFDLAKRDPQLAASKVFPLLLKAARRRRMAEVLGVTDPREQGALAREAGSAFDRVATAAKRVGVQLDLSRRGSRRELLEVSALLFSRSRGNGTVADAVTMARELIAEVDKAVTPVRMGDPVGGMGDGKLLEGLTGYGTSGSSDETF